MAKRKITVLVFAGLALLAASALGFGVVLAAHKGFGNITDGFITKYNGGTKQDLSGAATNGEAIVFVDDSLNIIRVVTGGLPDNTAVNRTLAPLHKDLEGATRWRGYFVVTTSLEAGALGAAPGPNFRRLTRFKLNEANQLTDLQSVDLRAQLMAALKEEFGDAWFDRIKIRAGKDGGLNIEGLSTTRHPGRDTLLLGLRSPLFGEEFATSGGPAGDPSNLRKGKAIIAEVEKPFSNDPSFEFITLNLDSGPYSNSKPPCLVSTPCGGSHGIRGMERVPAMQGFVIVGGPGVKGDDYSLWWWDGDDDGDDGLERLDVPGASITAPFRQLCRPETVLQIEENGEPFLVVFSEQSDTAPATTCATAPFTFIKARIVPANN